MKLRLFLDVEYGVPDDEAPGIEDDFLNMVQQLPGDTAVQHIEAKIDDRVILDYTKPGATIIVANPVITVDGGIPI